MMWGAIITIATTTTILIAITAITLIMVVTEVNVL